MRKYFLFAMAAIVSLVFAACSEDVLSFGQDEEMLDVTYTINTMSQASTRASHDEDGNALKINRYICEVWHVNTDNSLTLYKREQNIVETEGTLTTRFDLRLVASHSYKVLFWADYANVNSGTNAVSDFYYNTSAESGLQEVAITKLGDPAAYSGNKDEMDAFYGKDDINNLKGSKNLNVTLTRPFAQLNVITTDIDDIKASKEDGTMVPDHVKLTVNAPTKFNVLTGETSESADISYTAAVYFTDSHNKKLNSSDPDFSYCTLAMSYILAPEEEKDLVTVKLDAINSDDVITSPEFSNIPLQRNYRTNIIGDLLTDGVIYNVEVKPNWDGEKDVNVTTVTNIAAANEALKTVDNVIVTVPDDAGTQDVIFPQQKENKPVTITIEGTVADDAVITFKNEVTDKTPSTVAVVAPAGTKLKFENPTHVVINGTEYASIEGVFSVSTLVISEGVTVGTLTIEKGGLEIHGIVNTVTTIPSEAEVIVRACEGLSESVYNVLKDFIDPEYVTVKQGETYDIIKPDAGEVGYKTNETNSIVLLPAAPTKNGNVWEVNAANAQYVLDGAYGAIDGKTIKFTENITEKLILGRPTKFEGSNTVYRHGGFSNAPLSYDDFIAYKTQSGWTEYSYYNRAISDVTFSANTGVTVAGFTACGGNHVYGTTDAPIYDYVRDNGTLCHDGNNGYYVYVELKNFKFNGLTFNGKTDIATSSDKTVIDNFEFNGCTFDINNTTSSNQAIRYYNENNNGNVKDLIVNNCTFKNCYQAIYTQHIKDITISECTVTTTGHNAFAIQSGTHGAVDHGEVKIINNNISGCGDRAIRFGDIADGTEITITGNNASYGDGTTSSSEEAIKASSIAEGVTITVDNNNWNNFKDPYNPEFLPAVAKIGETKYSTLAKAVTAAESGATIEIIMAGTYTVPGIAKNITVKGAVESVVFNCVGTGSIASIPNGCTFENVEFNMGTSDYHGFQHAGLINMNGCVINGKFFSYGDMNFTGCTFNQTASDYCMWDYGKDLTYKNCTFNAAGKFINAYNEGNGNWKLTVEGCTFNSSKKNKAALNIKASCNTVNLGWEVRINNCTVGDATKFPEASGDETSALYVGSPIWQVDDRTASSLAADIVRVYVDGEKVY